MVQIATKNGAKPAVDPLLSLKKLALMRHDIFMLKHTK
jgi:hypothetical protein